MFSSSDRTLSSDPTYSGTQGKFIKRADDETEDEEKQI